MLNTADDDIPVGTKQRLSSPPLNDFCHLTAAGEDKAAVAMTAQDDLHTAPAHTAVNVLYLDVYGRCTVRCIVWAPHIPDGGKFKLETQPCGTTQDELH